VHDLGLNLVFVFEVALHPFCQKKHCLQCYDNYWVAKRRQWLVANQQADNHQVMPIKCSACPNEGLGHLDTISTKSKWVISRVRELLDEWNNQGNAAAKIVVVSSCAGTLTWFNRAFTGLRISSSLCTRYNALAANTIQSFVSDPTIRILLITPSVIRTKFVLPIAYNCQ
jgi:hypothetical protein